MSDVIYTPEDAHAFVVERNAHYDAVIASINPTLVKQRVQWCRDRALNPVLLNSKKIFLKDTEGRSHSYWELAKRPVNDQWPKTAMENQPPVEDWPNDANVGVQCGTPVEINGKEYYLCDLDFDDVKYIPIWRELYKNLGLPATFRYGRTGKRESHNLFYIAEPTCSNQGDGKVEIRCQTKTGLYEPYGNQTVLPGSVWTNGTRIEQITVEEDSALEPAVVETKVLLMAHKALLAVGELVC